MGNDSNTPNFGVNRAGITYYVFNKSNKEWTALGESAISGFDLVFDNVEKEEEENNMGEYLWDEPNEMQGTLPPGYEASAHYSYTDEEGGDFDYIVKREEEEDEVVAYVHAKYSGEFLAAIEEANDVAWLDYRIRQGQEANEGPECYLYTDRICCDCVCEISARTCCARDTSWGA